jgi:hypothetical protein
LKAYNESHLYLEQVSDDKQGAVIDWFLDNQGQTRAVSVFENGLGEG